MTDKKFEIEVFNIEKIKSRIKELDDEIKRREEKLADTIIDAINKPKTNDKGTNDSHRND